MTKQLIFSFDILALFWFFAMWAGYSNLTHRGTLAKSGLVARGNELRRQWMRQMALREIRMMDAQLINALASGNAFFASTTVLVIAGLLATMGAIGNVREILETVPFLGAITNLEVELKIGLMISVYIFAFFKFAWAYRLSLNTAIMIGATPEKEQVGEKTCLDHARRTADMAILVERHGTAGLRAFYFGMAVLSWLLHPIAFMVASAWVVLVLYRREYRSKALGAIDNL